MGAGLSAEVKLPDVWFDFYARLLPGTAFVAATYYVLCGEPPVGSALEVFVMFAVGYFCGLVTQPVSSRLTHWVHELIAWLHRAETLYVRKVTSKVHETEGLVLSKMHAETTFFVQCFVLGSAFLFVRYSLASSGACILSIALLLLFLLEAAEVADRRFRRARDDMELMQHPDIGLRGN